MVCGALGQLGCLMDRRPSLSGFWVSRSIISEFDGVRTTPQG
jgi:hypothetical protein